jgi:hypothetical protein
MRPDSARRGGHSATRVRGAAATHTRRVLGFIVALGACASPVDPRDASAIAADVARADTPPAVDAEGSHPDVARHVSPCNALAIQNTWESITPSGVSWTGAIIVDPFDPATLWVGATGRGFMRSDDCGATWRQVSTGRNTDRFNLGLAVSAVVDPLTPGTIVSNNNDGPGGMWRSTNGGVDWDELWPAGGTVASAIEYNVPNGVGVEAADPRHLVVGMHAACRPPHRAVCLAESTDAGQTWRIVDGPLAATSWVAGAAVFLIDASTWLFGTYGSGLWLTRDRGATWREVTAAGAAGSTSGKTVVLPFTRSAASGAYYLADMQGVLRSTDGVAWTLLPGARFRTVGLAVGGGRVFASDQWSPTYWVADETDLAHFRAIPPPAALPSDQGAPYLAYDAAHRVLYSSNWAGGLWRMVVE